MRYLAVCLIIVGILVVSGCAPEHEEAKNLAVKLDVGEIVDQLIKD